MCIHIYIVAVRSDLLCEALRTGVYMTGSAKTLHVRVQILTDFRIFKSCS